MYFTTAVYIFELNKSVMHGVLIESRILTLILVMVTGDASVNSLLTILTHAGLLGSP